MAKKYASLTTLQTLVSNIKSRFATKAELNEKSNVQMITTSETDSTVEHLPTLKIYRLTQEQYEEKLANNDIDETALYITPDEEGYTQIQIDEILSGKANVIHNHSIEDVTNLQNKLDSKVPTSRTINNKPLTANITLSASDVGASASGHNHDDRYYTETEIDTKLSGKSDTTHNHDTKYEAKNSVSTHNTSTTAHNDIRDLITGLTTRLNTLANSDDTTLDQMSEIVAYIKNNKSLIDGVTTNKVNVADIVNNLTTNVTNKPLSAAQGVVIQKLINDLQAELDSHKHTVSEISDLTATATELNYMDGVTSNVQSQLDELENDKADKIHIHPYGVCSTDAATAAKTVTVSDFALTTGVRVVVKFTTTNTAYSPTLNVNGTGAKNIYYNGRKIYARYLAADKVYEFVYDGEYWVLVGDNITDLMETDDPTGTGKISINRKADTTSGSKSVAMGNNPTASGSFSVALGEYTTASGESSFAEGSYTTASGVKSHAEGSSTTASANISHAEGNNTTASGDYSHSEGSGTVASGKAAHAEGYTTNAAGEYSHSEGYYTNAFSDYQHVQGAYNIDDKNGKYLHIVGNGKDEGGSIIPSNAHTIDWNGNGWFQGDVYVGGEHQDDYGVSKLMKESDYEWNLIYNSGSITAKANSISGIDISGYKRIMVAVSCVNDGTNISKSGSVIFTGTHGQTYQFPCWTNMFSTTANATSAGIAQFDIIYGYIVCPTALRSIRTSNFLTAGEGGTADNLTSTGGGIMRCTDDLTTLAVSSLDQDASCHFGVGSKVMVWGCKI